MSVLKRGGGDGDTHRAGVQDADGFSHFSLPIHKQITQRLAVEVMLDGACKGVCH